MTPAPTLCICIVNFFGMKVESTYLCIVYIIMKPILLLYAQWNICKFTKSGPKQYTQANIYMQIAKPVFPFTNIPKIRRTTARERAEKFKEHNFNPTLIFLHSLQVLRFIFIANK